MSRYLTRLRERVHPLTILRRNPFSRALVRTIDIPIWAKVPNVNWKVRLRLVRHASVFLLPGGMEPAIFAVFSAIVRELGIRTFWDVGANIGYYTWLTKSLAPASTITMFEPDEDNATLIRHTLNRSRTTGVLLRNLAVSDMCRQVRFARDNISGLTGGIEETLDTIKPEDASVCRTSVMIDTITLDSERLHGGGVDLIKIDVEGHEEAVIRGGIETITRDQPIVIFECFHGGTEITNILSQCGYWVGDAERMTDDLHAATNFLALPTRHQPLIERLKSTWSIHMMGFNHMR